MLLRVCMSKSVVLLAAALLAGCAALSDSSTLTGASAVAVQADAPPQSDIPGAQVISVVTTRKAVDGARTAPWFGSERASQMSIAEVHMLSPKAPGRFLAATGLLDWKIERVDKVPNLSIASSGPTRDVLLYVHGYNQTFATATLDAVRLSDSLGFRGNTVLFSWPSRDKLLEYIRDRESAMWSRDALETTIDSLLASPNVGRIHIVAHSMGSMVTLEALRQVYAQHRASVADRLGAIVFASPDLDIDGFSSSVRRMGRLAERMTIITASDDRALAMAANISGGGRVGSAEKARLETLGLKVVDASGLGWGILNHDLFLTNDQVKRVIRQAIEETQTPSYARSVSAEPLPAPMQ